MTGNNVTDVFSFNVTNTVASVAGTAGNLLVGTITSSLPVVLPVLAVLWGIRFTLGKIGLN